MPLRRPLQERRSLPKRLSSLLIGVSPWAYLLGWPEFAGPASKSGKLETPKWQSIAQECSQGGPNRAQPRARGDYCNRRVCPVSDKEAARGITFLPASSVSLIVGVEVSYNQSAFPPKGTVPIVTSPPRSPTIGTGLDPTSPLRLDHTIELSKQKGDISRILNRKLSAGLSIYARRPAFSIWAKLDRPS